MLNTFLNVCLAILALVYACIGWVYVSPHIEKHRASRPPKGRVRVLVEHSGLFLLKLLGGAILGVLVLMLLSYLMRFIA
ncbi:hypothetical protein [Microvirga sesbaniae]|uniref:hypothetical protein n=1 Tax=Microvirga sesbaniae TaxID=681392 RepID=UPI0021C57A27|nr:hypothetical protein [Microvirga sp. HBU67692]